jgi:hypothetical protein
MLPQIATATDILPTDHGTGLFTDFHSYLSSHFYGHRGSVPLFDSSGFRTDCRIRLVCSFVSACSAKSNVLRSGPIAGFSEVLRTKAGTKARTRQVKTVNNLVVYDRQ